MALYDVDPNTTNRLEPMPQASDQNPTRSSDGTTAITNKQDGSGGAYTITKDATVKVNDGDVNRVSLGLLSDGSYGLKVSPEGVDVLTASDDQLVFNSSQNVFKIVDVVRTTLLYTFAARGVGTGSGSSSGGSPQTIYHGLGYVPAFLAYATTFDGTYQQISSGSIAQTGVSPGIYIGTATETSTWKTWRIIVDDNYIYLDIYRGYAQNGGTVIGEGPGDIPITIYLLQETAN